MGIEKDIELMDDYLANRLSDAERISFEQKLEADPALKSEFITQKSFIEGIKNARIAELKAIMNNTPIPPAASTSVATLKVAAWVLAIGIIGFGVYWFTRDEAQTPEEAVEEVTPMTPQEDEIGITEEQPIAEAEGTITEVEEPVVKEETKKASKPKTSKVKQPKLDVYDPTKDAKEETDTEAVEPILPGEKQKVSALVVETDSSQKKYDFHYKFQDGKLILLGSFDATLYEILEFFADDKRTMFLYYTGEYYLLDESKSKPTPLVSITDKELRKKLEAYRAN